MEQLKSKWWIIVLAGIAVFLSYRQMTKTRERVEQEIQNAQEGGEPKAAAPAGRVAEATKLMYQDAAGALTLLDQILAAPADAAEKASAQALLPDVLGIVLQKQVSAKQYDDAEKILRRLKTDFPNDNRTRSAVFQWSRAMEQKIKDAVSAGNEEALDAAFAKYKETGGFVPGPKGVRGDEDAFKQYATFKLERWKKMPAASRFSRDGAAVLAEGLGVILDWNTFFQTMLNPVREDKTISGEDLMKQAEAFEREGQDIPAFNAYWLARSVAQSGEQWFRQADAQTAQSHQAREAVQVALDWKLATLAPIIAQRCQRQPASVPMALKPADFLRMLLNGVQTPAYRTHLLQQCLGVRGIDFMNRTEPLMAISVSAAGDENRPYEERLRISELLHDGRSAAREVFEEGRQMVFSAMMNDPNPTAWKDVDPAVVAEIRQRAAAKSGVGTVEPQRAAVKSGAGNVESHMRSVCKEMVEKGEIPIPVSIPEAVQARHYEFLARDGVNRLVSNRDEAARALRPVVRESRQPELKRQVQAAVESGILNAQKKGQFEVLVELAGLYAAEFADQLVSGPFKADYRKALEAAAAQFGTKDSMKTIFVKALLAAAFPGEDVGIKAQQEAVKMALASVAGVTPDQDFGVDLLQIPSAIPGFSSVAVDNSTEYHILVFYEGPESVTVLCNPYRRGTFLLKNGAYEVAVLAPAGRIRPYHGKVGLKDAQKRSVYHIVQQGQGSSFSGSGMTAHGDYTLLRTSPGIPPLKVDPKSGLVRLAE